MVWPSHQEGQGSCAHGNNEPVTMMASWARYACLDHGPGQSHTTLNWGQPGADPCQIYTASVHLNAWKKPRGSSAPELSIGQIGAWGEGGMMFKQGFGVARESILAEEMRKPTESALRRFQKCDHSHVGWGPKEVWNSSELHGSAGLKTHSVGR